MPSTPLYVRVIAIVVYIPVMSVYTHRIPTYTRHLYMRLSGYPGMMYPACLHACTFTCMCLHLHAHLDVYRTLAIILPYKRMYPSLQELSKCY